MPNWDDAALISGTTQNVVNRSDDTEMGPYVSRCRGAVLDRLLTGPNVFALVLAAELFCVD